jgi:hypothetical protein
MTFRSIGTLASAVLAEVEAKRAGAIPAEIGAPRLARMGGKGDEARAQDRMASAQLPGNEGGDVAGNGNKGKAGDTACDAVEGKTAALTIRRSPSLSLVTSNNGKSRHFVPREGVPPRSLGFPLLRVV